MTHAFTLLSSIKYCEQKKCCGYLFIDTNVDITQQSIAIIQTPSAMVLLCARKALAVKMCEYVTLGLIVSHTVYIR